MVLKIINATEAKVGTNIIVDGISCVVKSIDISKTGKHGHAKCRIEAINVIDGKKKVLLIPGHDKLEVPMMEKKKAQVLSTNDNMASVMDLESFETLDVDCPDEDLKNSLEESGNAEYWDIEGIKLVKRKL